MRKRYMCRISSIKTALVEAEAAHREFSAKLVREAHRCVEGVRCRG